MDAKPNVQAVVRDSDCNADYAEFKMENQLRHQFFEITGDFVQEVFALLEEERQRLNLLKSEIEKNRQTREEFERNQNFKNSGTNALKKTTD